MMMTIRKANADRKSVDKEIRLLVNDLSGTNKNLIAFYRKSRPIIGTLTPQEVEDDIKSLWQKLNDLIHRREQLNTATMRGLSGVATFSESFLVEVPVFKSLDTIDETNTEKISIAAAIARKAYYSDVLIQHLQALSNSVASKVSEFDRYSQQMEAECKKQVNTQFGPESSTNAKGRVEYAEQIKGDYEVVLIDPLKIVKRLETATEAVRKYISEIDSKISNATEINEVEVED